MIISVLSPHAAKTGNSVTSMLLAHGLADTKRKTILTHVNSTSPSFEKYLGLQEFDDKTSTPSQLVKLMRLGAIQIEELEDYCKGVMDFLDVFTDNTTNFSREDMDTLLEFLLTSSSTYDYQVYDIDLPTADESAKRVLSSSDIIILNMEPSIVDLDKFKEQKDEIKKICHGKKVILLCSIYEPKAVKIKDLVRYLGVTTSVLTIRYNPWVKWACNNGKLNDLFVKGKLKDPSVVDINRDIATLVRAINKARVAISKKGVKMNHKAVFKDK